MLKMTDTKRRWPAVAAMGAIRTAALVLGSFPGSASAGERERDRDHRDYHHRDWNGGYYRAPPVVYGTPYYAPPVVYGPGLNINIR